MTFFEGKKEEKKEKEVDEGATEEISEKIKIGEDEYSQDELQKLVGLGKIGLEAEEKYNTKIDKVWPDYTKKSQLLKELEEKEAKRVEDEKVAESKVVAEKTVKGEELTPEEQAKQALGQADGLGIVTKENFGRFYHQLREGERLVDDCKGLEKEINGKDGRPAFVTSDILAHMRSSGVRNPQDAYDLKFKPELNSWREKKIGNAKLGGLVTEGSSTAGKKSPAKVDITPQNLDKMINESLYGDK